MARFAHLEIFHPVACLLGEGPCWHASRQTLWWIDITGRKLFESDLSGTPPRIVELSQLPGAVAPTREGGLVAALQDGIYLVNPDSGVPTLFANAPGHDSRQFRFNDAKVDPRGRYWAGTLALDGRRGESHLYRINPDRSVAIMREGVSISNGLAWSPDGSTLYYIDTPTREVRCFAFDLETGRLGESKVVITLGDADGWPDGCCMDVDGRLWIAHWGGSKITRWDPRTGRLLDTIAIPVRNVTSCAFGGAKLDELFITTARDDDKSVAEPEAGHVFCLKPGATGVPLATFAGAL
jgi:sugar lactone lactonase YvrE